MSLETFLIKHRVYCELCSAPIPATKVCQIRRRPQWPETKTVVVCDAHWRANSPVEAGLRTNTETGNRFLIHHRVKKQSLSTQQKGQNNEDI